MVEALRTATLAGFEYEAWPNINLGIRYIRLDQVDLAMATIVCAMPLVLPLVYFMMKHLSRAEPR